MPPHLLDEHCLQVDEERATFVRALLDGAVPMDRVTAVTVRSSGRGLRWRVRRLCLVPRWLLTPPYAAYPPPSLRLVGWLEGLATMFLAYV